MAAEKIHAARYLQHGTPKLTYGTYASFGPTATSSRDPGVAGTPGDAGGLVTNRGLQVSFYGQDFAELLALVGAVAANAIVGISGLAGALEKITFKNVYFDQILGEMMIPAKDGGAPVSVLGIRGTAQWGASDTFALMAVGAADT